MSAPAFPGLPAYLERIGHHRRPRPSAAALAALQAAHLAAIPFENLDPRLGRPVRLDLESLEAKLVRGGRGGYCFEHNTLFAAVLREIGFAVATLEARVRPPGAAVPLPRTHMTLCVAADGRDWLVDVGFGGDGPLVPVPLDGTASDQPGGAYRVAREGPDTLVLQLDRGTGWGDLYACALRPAFAVDFEVANHYTATHPSSIFVRTLTAQRVTAAARHILRGRSYTRRAADGSEATRGGLADTEIHELLRTAIGLEVDAGELRAALAGL